MKLDANTSAELDRRALVGLHPVPIKLIEEKLALLGYALDRKNDWKHVARYLSGPYAGSSYLCCTTVVKEMDTGLSAFHYKARRGDNFLKLQSMRFKGELFAVTKDGFIFEI